MANKRMFSVDVVETDAFLDLPPKVQALYFHLGMRADDDGFVSSPRTIVRTIGCNAGDLKQLEAAGYVISFNSGVLVVTDWKVNNTLKSDRHTKTVYQRELSLLKELILSVSSLIYQNRPLQSCCQLPLTRWKCRTLPHPCPTGCNTLDFH